MTESQFKQDAATAAIQYVEPDTIVGVGTGSTVAFFIDALAQIKQNIMGAVASSKDTEDKLKAHGIPVLDIHAGHIPLYVDGADEFNDKGQLIKGGGGALTREKIIAATAEQFICIADASKHVKVLGEFPLPVEVIPMARSLVARELVKMGGDPVYREGVITDNGNIIIDVYSLDLTDPIAVEMQINNITGVVCNGLFAKKGADLLLVADETGVIKIKP